MTREAPTCWKRKEQEARWVSLQISGVQEGLVRPQIRINDTNLDCIFKQFKPSMHPEFAGDAATVFFNCFGTDAEDIGNFLGGFPFNHKPEDLLLTFGQ